MTTFQITMAIIGGFFIGIAATAGAIAALVLYGGKLLERNKKIQAAKEELRKAMHGRGAFTLKNIADTINQIPGVAFSSVTVKEVPSPAIMVKVAFYDTELAVYFGDLVETVSKVTPITVAVEYDIAVVIADGDVDFVSTAVNDYKGLK